MSLVLLVDDSPTQRLFHYRQLRRCGVDVLLAVDGMQALDKARRYHPDLILMDIDMPQLDGLQACRELSRHRSTRDIPVVMLSSCEQPSCKLRALMRGASDYLVKPVKHPQLCFQLEKMLDSPMPA